MLEIYDNCIGLSVKGREVLSAKQGFKLSDRVEDLGFAFGNVNNNFQNFIDFMMFCINFLKDTSKPLEYHKSPKFVESEGNIMSDWIEFDEGKVYYVQDYVQDQFYYEVICESPEKFVKELLCDLKNLKERIKMIVDKNLQKELNSVFEKLNVYKMI